MGPRPQEPWGLRHLRLRELWQLQVANRLLQTALLFCAIAVATGMIAIVEHPAKPRESHIGSTWRLLLRLLLSDRVSRVHVLYHCFGGPAMKPTHFL